MAAQQASLEATHAHTSLLTLAYFHCSSSEPRQRSKLRKNSSTEPGGAPAANSARVGTKHVPARGKSILNIKAALGSAMASVLNPVMQTQRK
eukprot:280529-Pelagomonas_calceolata.AAC.1